MYAAKGVGLAAPQIGIGKTIAVIDISNGEDPAAEARPDQSRDHRHAKATQKGEEGCLSIPGSASRSRRANKRDSSRAERQGRGVRD